jgi:hypothetical protein
LCIASRGPRSASGRTEQGRGVVRRIRMATRLAIAREDSGVTASRKAIIRPALIPDLPARWVLLHGASLAFSVSPLIKGPVPDSR